jgi:immune inhibitor A
MKRISLLVFFLIINIVTIHAAKAFNVPITITQPDGMELTVINHGDEDLHWYTTTDGVILYHSGSYFYIAAIDDNGNMTSTSQLAHESGQRNATEQALIALQNKNKFYSS